MPIISLQWDHQGVSFGPRGVRYELVETNGLTECRAFSAEIPAGIVVGHGDRTRAMLSAQSDAERIYDRIDRERQALSH